jgi:hypothetical protein
MAAFLPIDMAIAAPAFRFKGDAEPNRAARRLLQTMAYHDGSHNYPYCWGYTIFRTVYTPGSDEAVARAIERLGVYAKAYVDDDIAFKHLPNLEPPDPLPNQEVWSRFHNEVIEDEETLANAGLEEVGRRFDAWIKERLTPDVLQRNRSNARFSLCLMLDQESIDSILSMSEEPHPFLRGPADKQTNSGWVKAITNEQQPEGGGRLWYRVGIHHFLWSLWFGWQDPDFILEYFEWVDEADGSRNLRGMGHSCECDCKHRYHPLHDAR